MIRFRCEQCGGSVKVPPAYAGRMGRCPSCKAVVRIPGTPEDGSQKLPHQARAAAAPVDEARTAPPPPPPRPLPEYEIERDDVELLEDPSAETDVMPAEEVIDAVEAKRRRRAARDARRQAAQTRAQAAISPLRRRNNLLRIIILVTIGIVLLAIAVTAVLLLSK